MGETEEGEVVMAELEATVVEVEEDMAVLVVETDMEAAVVEGVAMAAEEGEGAVMEVATVSQYRPSCVVPVTVMYVVGCQK